MSGQWKTSRRREELPPDWPALREAQLRRDDYRCVWILPSGQRCPNKATDVDHYGEKWEHHKLRSLCSGHHDKRTAQQGVEEAARRRPVPPRSRRQQKHPSQGWQ
jgi:5-methylcytosine-specific restriction protein A